MQLLLVEDDATMQATLQRSLARRGMAVTALADGRAALAEWRARPPDAVVLDLTLPGLDGLQVLQQARAGGLRTPVLLLTARGTVGDRVLGLNAGADDYLPKPFELGELVARLRALLRRATPLGDDAVLRFGRLEVDVNARQVRVDGRVCELTSYQFDILQVMAHSPGRVLSRDQIMDALKGHPIEAFDRSIDVHVSRIRAAIEDDPKNPRRILTVRGSGYVFARKQDADAA